MALGSREFAENCVNGRIMGKFCVIEKCENNRKTKVTSKYKDENRRIASLHLYVTSKFQEFQVF